MLTTQVRGGQYHSIVQVKMLGVPGVLPQGASIWKRNKILPFSVPAKGRTANTLCRIVHLAPVAEMPLDPRAHYQLVPALSTPDTPPGPTN